MSVVQGEINWIWPYEIPAVLEECMEESLHIPESSCMCKKRRKLRAVRTQDGENDSDQEGQAGPRLFSNSIKWNQWRASESWWKTKGAG